MHVLPAAALNSQPIDFDIVEVIVGLSSNVTLVFDRIYYIVIYSRAHKS